VQHILRRKDLLPPALPERFRRCGHLHDQTTLAVPDGNEVEVLVEGLCFVVWCRPAIYGGAHTVQVFSGDTIEPAEDD
jgi:hypothetical protein